MIGLEEAGDRYRSGWDYYGKTIISDGKQYDVLINIRDTGEKQYVYDITLKATKKQDSQAAKPKPAYGQENPVTNTISEVEEKGNTRFQSENQTRAAGKNQNNKENVRFQLKNPLPLIVPILVCYFSFSFSA